MGKTEDCKLKIALMLGEDILEVRNLTLFGTPEDTSLEEMENLINKILHCKVIGKT